MKRRIKQTWKHRLARRINRRLREHVGDAVEVYYSPNHWLDDDPRSRGHILGTWVGVPWKEGHIDCVCIDLRKPEPFMEQLANEFHAVAAAYSELAERIAAARTVKQRDDL